MFISTALAQEAAASGGAMAGLQAFLPLILIFVIFYFLLIRPQQKRMKQHREMLTQIRRGDRVVTGGGIIGQVTKVVNDTELMVEIAEGVRVKVIRSTVSEVLSKTEPASGGGGKAANDEKGGKKGRAGQLGKKLSGQKDEQGGDEQFVEAEDKAESESQGESADKDEKKD